MQSKPDPKFKVGDRVVLDNGLHATVERSVMWSDLGWMYGMVCKSSQLQAVPVNEPDMRLTVSQEIINAARAGTR